MGDVKITRGMIEAGSAELLSYNEEYDREDEAAAEIFGAMYAAMQSDDYESLPSWETPRVQKSPIAGFPASTSCRMISVKP